MNFIKGILIGITMMIPGLSGGSCAMVLKVYTPLMESLSNIFNFKNILFCLKLGIGMLFGILFFSFFLYHLTLYRYFKYFIQLIILLNITLLIKDYNCFKIRYIILVISGYILMYLLRNSITFEINFNLITYLFIGILLAISLILPGLGASYVLYILNLYDKVNYSLVNFDFLFLSLLSLSTIIGVFISANAINFILKKDKYIIYSLVIGLLLGGI